MSDFDSEFEGVTELDEVQPDDAPVAVAAPIRPATFTDCGGGVDALDDPTPYGHENALQKLGKPPFEKSVRSKFRLLGYLATVYEHVSDDLKRDQSDAAPNADADDVGAGE